MTVRNGEQAAVVPRCTSMTMPLAVSHSKRVLLTSRDRKWIALAVAMNRHCSNGVGWTFVIIEDKLQLGFGNADPNEEVRDEV